MGSGDSVAGCRSGAQYSPETRSALRNNGVRLLDPLPSRLSRFDPIRSLTPLFA
jgi:hypothetical protein